MLWTPPLRRATSWRIMQISLYLGALAFSIGCLVGYKGLNALFDTDMASCILYAHATFQTSAVEGSLVSPQNCTVTMDRNSDYTCRFVYFNIICSFVYSIVGCWFFIACTSEAKTRPDETAIQSWKLVVPSIFFTFILSLMSLIGSALIDRGIASFKNPFVSEASRLQCARFKLTRVTEAPTFFGQFRVYASISESFSWLCTGCWMAGLVVLVCRCCLAADFVTQSEVGENGRRKNNDHAGGGDAISNDLVGRFVGGLSACWKRSMTAVQQRLSVDFGSRSSAKAARSRSRAAASVPVPQASAVAVSAAAAASAIPPSASNNRYNNASATVTAVAAAGKARPAVTATAAAAAPASDAAAAVQHAAPACVVVVTPAPVAAPVQVGASSGCAAAATATAASVPVQIGTAVNVAAAAADLGKPLGVAGAAVVDAGGAPLNTRGAAAGVSAGNAQLGATGAAAGATGAGVSAGEAPFGTTDGAVG